MSNEHGRSSILAKGVSLDNFQTQIANGNGTPKENIEGSGSQDVGKFVMEGRFTEINPKKFPDIPTSLLLIAQREALLNSLRIMRRHQQDFTKADITGEMDKVVNRFDNHVKTPEGQRPSIDVLNWEPADSSSAALDSAVQQGRFEDVNQHRFPQFSDHPYQLASYKITAIGRAIDLGQSVRSSMQIPSYGSENARLSNAIGHYIEGLENMKKKIAEEVFINNRYDALK